MNKEDLFDAIGQVDEELLVDPQAIGHHAVSTAKKRRFLALAACLCLVVVGVFAFFAKEYDFSSESAFDQLENTQAALQATTVAATDFGNLSDDVVTSNALATEPFDDPNTTTSAPQTTVQYSQTTTPYELIDSYSTSEIDYIGTPFTQEQIDEICETYDLYGTNGEKILLEDCYYMLEISSDSNIINQNFLYYTIYNGDKVTGQITFFEEVNYSIVSFDSDTYFFVNNLLEETNGETLYVAQVLNNYTTIYITQSGDIYSQDSLVDELFSAQIDYAELFGCEENVFK